MRRGRGDFRAKARKLSVMRNSAPLEGAEYLWPNLRLRQSGEKEKGTWPPFSFSFLLENSLSTTLYNSRETLFLFNKFLSAIYADTPLIIDYKVKVLWKGNIGENSYGGVFKFENI